MSLPEFVPIYKEILITGRTAVFKDILKLRRKYRRVVQDKVQLQINAKRIQRLQILLLRHQLVQPVINYRKAAIQIRVEKTWKDVERSKSSCQLGSLQKIHNVVKRASYAVRISVQHRPDIVCEIIHTPPSLYVFCHKAPVLSV